MADEPHTLAFGVTYDMVAARTASGQLVTLTSHIGDDEIPPHRHVNDYLCIVLSGGFSERERNTWHERPSGSFFVHHAGEMHYDRVGSRGAMCLNLHFGEGESGTQEDGLCPPEAKVAAEKLAFELAANGREELVIASLAAEIIAGLAHGAVSPDPNGTWMDRIVSAISDEADRRWSLAELARIADRHPVHLAQAFRARTGVSLGRFQRLRRLTFLSLALRQRTTPLAALAAEFGYFDQSHMTAEFRAAFGISPGRYRRLVH